MCKLISLAIVLSGSLITTATFAVNLVEVYQQAATSDPKFKAARAAWLADRESLAISKSALLPQLSGSATLSRTRNEQETVRGDSNYFNNNSGYSLTLTQPIFNFSNWSSSSNSQKSRSNFSRSKRGAITTCGPNIF